MITTAILSAAVGVILSLLFSYVPKLNTWYAAQSEQYKKLFMLGVLVAVSAGILVLSCVPIAGAPLWVLIGCSRQELMDFAVIVISMLIGNQSMYSITPPTSAVKDAKLRAKIREVYGEPEEELLPGEYN